LPRRRRLAGSVPGLQRVLQVRASTAPLGLLQGFTTQSLTSTAVLCYPLRETANPAIPPPGSKMARRRSKQTAVAATASLLLVGLGLTALNPRNRALLPMVQDSSGNHRPLQESRAAAVGGRGEAGHGWPESWGREVGLRPGVRLPNQGRSKVGWAGVRDDSGWRSPHYGGVQRGHQAWLLQRAEEMRSSEGVASVDTHSGGRVEGGTGDTNAAQGNTDGEGEEAGVAGEAGENKGGSPVAVDSEGPTRAGEAAAAAG
ncbi:unnamed protein product, partial [Ectocarpus sp. 12 AP-2014]